MTNACINFISCSFICKLYYVYLFRAKVHQIAQFGGRQFPFKLVAVTRQHFCPLRLRLPCNRMSPPNLPGLVSCKWLILYHSKRRKEYCGQRTRWSYYGLECHENRGKTTVDNKLNQGRDRQIENISSEPFFFHCCSQRELM